VLYFDGGPSGIVINTGRFEHIGFAIFAIEAAGALVRGWRDQRDWTARKYEMWTTGEKLPSQKPSSMMRCPCGEMFDSHRLENTLIHVPHITAEHKSVKFAEPDRSVIRKPLSES